MDHTKSAKLNLGVNAESSGFGVTGSILCRALKDVHFQIRDFHFFVRSGLPQEPRTRNRRGFARNLDPNPRGPVPDSKAIKRCPKDQKGLENVFFFLTSGSDS